MSLLVFLIAPALLAGGLPFVIRRLRQRKVAMGQQTVQELFVAALSDPAGTASAVRQIKRRLRRAAWNPRGLIVHHIGERVLRKIELLPSVVAYVEAGEKRLAVYGVGLPDNSDDALSDAKQRMAEVESADLAMLAVWSDGVPTRAFIQFPGAKRDRALARWCATMTESSEPPTFRPVRRGYIGLELTTVDEDLEMLVWRAMTAHVVVAMDSGPAATLLWPRRLNAAQRQLSRLRRTERKLVELALVS